VHFAQLLQEEKAAEAKKKKQDAAGPSFAQASGRPSS
jgi:hypothetical protein